MINESCVGIGTIVVDKRFDIAEAWRQSDQIEKDATGQCVTIYSNRRPQSFRFESCKNETVDGALCQVASVTSGRSGPIGFS